MNKGLESPEPTGQLKVERLDGTTDAKTFQKYERQIAGLSRNALDTREGSGLTEREDEVKGLSEKYLASGKGGKMFVAIKDDVVVAFVAIKRKGNDEGGLVVEQVRYAAGLREPKMIMESLLKGVRASLMKSGKDASIETEGAHHNLSNFGESSWFQDVFSFKEPEETRDELGADV